MSNLLDAIDLSLQTLEQFETIKDEIIERFKALEAEADRLWDEREEAREAAQDMRDTMLQEASGCLGCPLMEMIRWYEQEYPWLPKFGSSQAVKESRSG